MKHGEILEEHTRLLGTIARKLSDNGTHELRISELEKAVFNRAKTTKRKPKK